MKSAEIKDISIKDLQERIETEKAQLENPAYRYSSVLPGLPIPA